MSISGSVLESAASNPVAGIRVRLLVAEKGFSNEAASDGTGRYQVDYALPPGSEYAAAARLVAEDGDGTNNGSYRTTTNDFTIPGYGSMEIDITVDPAD